MRFIKGFLPHLSAALSAALLVVVILNEFNPRMGFLQGKPALTLIGLSCLCALICAVMLYIEQKKK